MSNWMPPKPTRFSNLGFVSDQEMSAYEICERKWSDWFDCEIKPIFARAMEVYADFRGYNPPIWSSRKGALATDSALLINVKKIQADTAEDILRDLIKKGKETNGGAYVALSRDDLERARRFLEQSNG